MRLLATKPTKVVDVVLPLRALAIDEFNTLKPRKRARVAALVRSGVTVNW